MTPATTPTTHTPSLLPVTNHPRPATARVLASVCLFLCGAWAFMPLGPAQVEPPETLATPTAIPETTPVALDVSAFSAPLWIAPAPPPSPVTVAPPAPPPPPLRWQLLAIVREDSGYKALLYDSDMDKLLALGEGDQSGPRHVTRVTSTSVEVRDSAGVRTLALREPATGGRP